MAQPPQTYELTTFSTIIVLFAFAIFFWLCVKLILSIVQWIIDRNSAKPKSAKDGKKLPQETSDETASEDEESELDAEDGTAEMADLETKKDN